MYPSREEANKLVSDAEKINIGPWGEHSRSVAECAEKIASYCADMNSEKAYILGLLHDIGRKFGVKHLGHVYDGYHYMLDLGYDEAARICLTHSFCNHNIKDYIGNHDINADQEKEITELLLQCEFDDYDRLIQLCDALGTDKGPVNMVIRMQDVKNRYHSYPMEKWIMNLGLKSYFEDKTGKDIYEIIGVK